MLSNLYEEEPHSIFIFKNPFRFLSRKGREIGVYLAGGLVGYQSKVLVNTCTDIY